MGQVGLPSISLAVGAGGEWKRKDRSSDSSELLQSSSLIQREGDRCSLSCLAESFNLLRDISQAIQELCKT